MLFTTKLAVLGLIAGSNAHIIMTNPKIFDFEDLANSQAPLKPDGSDFPCKMAGGTYGMNGVGGNRISMPLGSAQYLAFVGSAVHGGGSCQVSITYDTKPTKSSTWKVIHSIQGGCPMRNIAGNNGNSASLPVPDKFDFTIPQNLPAGDATLAWTWFNKVGNREMYMNCAPITIPGSGKDVAAYNALPNMFTANIDGKCISVDNKAVKFPAPGSSLEINGPASDIVSAVGSTCATDGGNAPAPAPVPSSAPQVTVAPTSSSAAAPSPTKATLPGGVFAPVNPTRVLIPNPSASKTTTVAPPAGTTKVNLPSAAPPAPSTTQRATTLIVVPTKPTTTKAIVAPPAPTGANGTQSGPCTKEGLWNCIGGTKFQQCASGSWSTPQSLAAGTQCTAGQSDAIVIKAIGFKRSPRFSSSHLRRHLGSHH